MAASLSRIRKFLVNAAVIGAVVLTSGCVASKGRKHSGNDEQNPNTQPGSEFVSGAINGGGGRGILCKSEQGEHVEVLDLYEARNLYKSEIIAITEGSFEEAALLLAKHFTNPDTVALAEHAAGLKETIQKVSDSITFLSDGKKIRIVDDAKDIVFQAGCQQVQIAVYYDESTLLVDQVLWAKLDWTNKVGLLLHELIYARARDNGETDSVATRRLVGKLLSKDPPQPRAFGVPMERANHMRCHVTLDNVDQGYFYAFDNDNGSLVFVFNYLANTSSLFRTSSTFTGYSLDSWRNPEGSLFLEAPLEVDTYRSNDRHEIKIEINEAGGRSLRVIDRAAPNRVSQAMFVSC